MGHLADQPLDGIARQSCIGIERDDVADAGRQVRRGVEERRVGRPAQQAVELVQLAALALPSHPAALGAVPDAAPVQQVETIATVAGRMASVEAKRSASPGTVSAAASAQSDSNAKCTAPRGLER